MRRVEWSEDRFKLRVVRADDDIGRIEAEPLPPACLEPIRVLGADQHEKAASRGRPFQLEDCARIGGNAGARYGELGPPVNNRECLEESSAYVGTRASGDKNASQPQGRFYANELRCSRAEVHGEPSTSCSHLENAAPVDLELREDARMNGFSLADGIPELRLELIHHGPEQSSTEPLGCFHVAAGGRLAFRGGDASQVLGWQASDIMEAKPLPTWRRCGNSLEVIHFYFDLPIRG